MIRYWSCGSWTRVRLFEQGECTFPPPESGVQRSQLTWGDVAATRPQFLEDGPRPSVVARLSAGSAEENPQARGVFAQPNRHFVHGNGLAEHPLSPVTVSQPRIGPGLGPVDGDHLLVFSDRVVVSSCRQERERHSAVVGQRDRIELSRAVRLDDRIMAATDDAEVCGVVAARPRQVRVQLDGMPESRVGFRPVPGIAVEIGQFELRLRQVWIQFRGPLRSGQRQRRQRLWIAGA